MNNNKKQYRQTYLFGILCCFMVTSLQTMNIFADQKNKFEWLPGAARAIPISESASRDRALFEYAYGPKAYSTIGSEWGWFRIHKKTRSFCFGMYAMVGFENHDWNVLFPPAELWRGMTGFSWCWSLNKLAENWLGTGSKFETGIVFAHESDHGIMDDPPKPDDISHGGGGEFLIPDIALRIPVSSKFFITGRIQCRIGLYGGINTAPGADLIFRWKPISWFNPVISLFGEGIFAKGPDASNGYFVRLITGTAFLGSYGEFTLFGSLDSGNGKGKLINHRRTRVSIGTRYAPFIK